MGDISIVIGERVRNFRKKLGLSQEELAHRASLHFTYIGQLERGEKNATIESMSKVANALEITLEELFRNTQTKDKFISYELGQIISLLDDRSESDQRAILTFIEALLQWRDEG
jgi:transcriptional regulator with XRE-family HTH domain